MEVAVAKIVARIRFLIEFKNVYTVHRLIATINEIKYNNGKRPFFGVPKKLYIKIYLISFMKTEV